MSSRSHRGVPNPPPYPSPLNSTTQSQHTGQASGNTLAGRLPDHALAKPSPRSEGQYMTRYEHTPAKAEASAKRFDKRVDFYDSAAAEYELPERKREYQEWVQSGRKKQDDPRERQGRKIHTSGTTEPTSGSGGHPDTGYLNWEQTGRLREGMTTDQDGRHSREWAQGQAEYTTCDPNFVSAPSSFMQATSSNVSFHRPPSPGDEMPMPYEPIPHGYSQNHPWNYDEIGSGSGAVQGGATSARPSRATSLAVPPASARGSRRDHGHGQGSSSRSGEGSRAHQSAQFQAAPLVYAPTGSSLQRAQPISQMQYAGREQSSHHGQSSHRSHTHGHHRSSNQRRRNRSNNGCCDVM